MNFNKEVFWVHMHNLSIACMSEKIGIDIGTIIGEVKECDVWDDGTRWGKALRVLTEFDITQPITSGCTINLYGVSSYLPLTYKNLSRLCFQCGKISHGLQYCEKGE